jgi:nitroimidazol reductase NimA-like FMN-containing flavoprotein (pyridoxamine 5'-phosphate oxidase superfamily)
MSVAMTPRLDALTHDECLDRLRETSVGRLAVVVGGQPLVFPVNYTMCNRQVVFRTGTGTKLHGAAGRQVAFEIDGIDPVYHEGWSVLVVGVAHEETQAARIHELEALPLTPWAGPRAHWMRIKGGAITGRRITHVAANAGDD